MSRNKDLDPERLNKSWSFFWQSPIATALPERFPANYDGPMLDFWRAQLDGRFDHIVDLATGNGALVWIAHDIQSRQDKPARITGVDLAAIDPFTALRKRRDEYPTISFIGNTSIESLPFADRSIDVVISQYGIEYSNLEKTIAEIGRVVTSSGKICFIIHDKESVIVKNITTKIEHCKDMIADHKFHELTRRFIGLLSQFPDARAMNKSVEFQRMVKQINKNMARLKPRLDRYPNSSPLNPYIQKWCVATNPSTPMPRLMREHHASIALTELKLRTENLEEVDAAALSPEDREMLAERIREQGFRISELGTLEYSDGRNWGTRLVAHRGGTT